MTCCFTSPPRPVEARAAITEARAQDPKAPGSDEAEGLLLDREDKDDAAKVALEKAVEGYLAKATTLNTRDAFVLARLRKYDEAAIHAEAAQRLANSDSERQRVKELLDHIAKARAGG